MNNLTDDDEISIHLERDPMLGQTLGGNYRVLSIIGRGGMGVVYKAKHAVIERFAAIKTLHIGKAGNAEAVRQFHKEARAVSQVNHPNTVKLYDFGFSPEGQPFLIMEFLNGTSLRQVMKESGPLPLARVNTIFQQVIAALGCAHQAGIVHKDLKPENIMVSEKADFGPDWVHVLDFGISALSANHAGTNGGAAEEQREIIGSPPYMSPEQCQRTTEIDQRSDIYSLAICIFEALSGTFPYKARTAMEVMECHISAKPKLLRDVAMSTSTYESLSQVLNKALEKKPEQRHQSMEEFGIELEDAITKDSKRGLALKDRISMEIPRTAEFVRVNREVIEDLEDENELNRKAYFASRNQGVMGMLKSIILGDEPGPTEATKQEPENQDKIIFFECPHCGAKTQPELSLCLCCGRSLAAKDDFSKLRAARGEFSLPKQKSGSKETPRVVRQEFSQRTKAAMVKTSRVWTRSLGLIFLGLLLVTCVFVMSGGYHLVMDAFSPKPQRNPLSD